MIKKIAGWFLFLTPLWLLFIMAIFGKWNEILAILIGLIVGSPIAFIMIYGYEIIERSRLADKVKKAKKDRYIIRSGDTVFTIPNNHIATVDKVIDGKITEISITTTGKTCKE